VASFFGVNPKQAMDQDLLRLKSLIERGETSAKGEKVTRQAVEGGRRSASQAAAQAKAYAQPARVSGDISGQASGGRGERPSSPDRTPATREGTPTDVYAGPQTAAESRRDSGVPGGGAGRVDEVGETGVYPMSGSERPPDDAPVQGMASWGQGERGAEGYEDSGSSELTGLGEETDLGSVIPGQPDEPNPES
jgi:hypothetical protein